jgi:RHS repeat-associated protein
VPNADPDGDGIAFDFPLGFPGQYADRETGISYNLRRDYDPFIGRYAESDPFGLRGDANTYAYVGGDPLRATDPTGEIAPAAAIGITAAIGAISAGTGAAIQGGNINQIAIAAVFGGIVGAAAGIVTVVGTAELSPGTALGVSMGISAITGATSNIVGQIATNPLLPSASVVLWALLLVVL